VCDRCKYRNHADVNAAKNICNNFIFTAAKTQKAKQALVNEPIVALAMTATSHQPYAGGH
jgi:transposase